MLGAIKNELFKFFHQNKTFYVFLAILLFICVIVFLIILMGNGNVDNEQQLPLSIINLSMLFMLLPMILTIIAVNMISGEYDSGTFKLPLLYKVSRSKLIIAKVLALIIIIFILLFIMMSFSYLMAYFLDWGEGVQIEGKYYSTYEGFLLTVKTYFIVFGGLIVWSICVFYLCLKIKREGTVLVISVGIMIILKTISIMFTAAKPYLFNTLHTIYSNYLFNSLELTIFIRSIIVQGIYGVLLLFLSLHTFKNKDIYR
mgnify:CR=1 FL=1